jgi:hypothetical protein
MSERDIWDGRPVTFRRLTIEEGEPIIDIMASGDGRAAGYALLAATLQWADTKELIFPGVDYIRSLPLRDWLTLQRFAAKARFENGLQDADPDEPPPPANGHDAHPSL